MFLLRKMFLRKLACTAIRTGNLKPVDFEPFCPPHEATMITRKNKNSEIIPETWLG